MILIMALCIQREQSTLYSTLTDHCFNLPGDVIEAIVRRCADLDGSLHAVFLF